MNKIKLSLVAMSALLLASSAFAGSSVRVGSAGGQELLIPVGARGFALGGGVVADAMGVEATHWNPAGVSRQDGTEVMFMRLPYFAGIDVNFFGASTQVGDLGTFAVAAKIVDVGDIEVTTEAQPEGTGVSFNPTLSVVGLTFSRQMTNKVNFGITANYINERIFDVSANSVSFDLGFMFEPQWNGVQLGMVIKNIGPSLRFGGRGFDRRDQDLGPRAVRPLGASAELPSYVNLGVKFSPPTDNEHSLSFMGNFQSNNFSRDIWIGAFEYGYDDKYFVRGAYNYSDQADYQYGASVGAGINVEISETRFTFEAAWREAEFFESDIMFTGKILF